MRGQTTIEKSMDYYIEMIDRQIAEKHLLNHPFYVAWTRGELSTAALCDYARQYYHHVAAFPTYLSAVHASCDDQATRKQLLKNLIDEEGGSPTHPELWLQFGEGLGLTDDNIRESPTQPETENLIATFRSVCRDGSTAEGVAALYAYESQIPAICESKIAGLIEHYGFRNSQHYQYFTVHLEADREHSAAERALLSAHLDNHNFEVLRLAVGRILDALRELLSAVCRRHALAC
jgi:pyrroloquinoline-quinone synthase